jgi:hypothetical protein
MNMYTKLKLHLSRNVYKRGANKGDAPLGKRWRTHVRVIEVPSSTGCNTMRVRMYGTDILKAYEDGRVVLDTQGWHDSPTTKLRMNEALGFMPFYTRIGSAKIMGVSQPYLRSNCKTVRYYDGIELDADGNVTSELKPFQRRRINRDESKELRDEMAECGFTGAFKILHATSVQEDYSGYCPTRTREAVTSDFYSNQWPFMVARYTWERIGYGGHYRKRTAAEAWAALTSHLRKDCYEVIDTDVTLL